MRQLPETVAYDGPLDMLVHRQYAAAMRLTQETDPFLVVFSQWLTWCVWFSSGPHCWTFPLFAQFRRLIAVQHPYQWPI